MAASAVDISLPGAGRCLRVENAPDVVEALARAMPGWPISTSAARGPTPDSYIIRDADGLWQGGVNEPDEFALPSAASAACSLVGELASQRLGNAPEWLGLHCGSVEIDGRLVLFPESSKAGKSTLTVAFAAAGYRVFGDDVLGLTAQGEGVAMGIAPRLRLPLPDSFSARFIDYAEQHAGPQDERYRFVIPPDNGLAHLDDACPVGAIVLLERDADIMQPEVVTLPPGEGLLQLLCQNFAHDTPDDVLLERLLPLMQRVPCLLLRYSEPLAGAECLAGAVQKPAREHARRVSLLDHSIRHSPSMGVTGSAAGAEKSPTPEAGGLWQASHAVSTYPLGDELFLIHTGTGGIHRLNPSGKVVWQLLVQEPLSADALSDVLAAYFNAPLETVVRDVAELLNAMAGAALIVASSR